MSRLSKFFVLLLLLLCAAPAAFSQDVFDVADRLKSNLQQNPRCWKLNRENYRRNVEAPEAEQEWKCGKEWIRVDMFQAPNDAAASAMFTEQRDQIVSSPEKIVDTYKFGDESRVTSYFPYGPSSYIFFRSGKIFVRIDSDLTKKGKSETTLRNAVLFAQLVVEQMAARN
jgi:hypothetical protein